MKGREGANQSDGSIAKPNLEEPTHSTRSFPMMWEQAPEHIQNLFHQVSGGGWKMCLWIYLFYNPGSTRVRTPLTRLCMILTQGCKPDPNSGTFVPSMPFYLILSQKMFIKLFQILTRLLLYKMSFISSK